MFMRRLEKLIRAHVRAENAETIIFRCSKQANLLASSCAKRSICKGITVMSIRTL